MKIGDKLKGRITGIQPYGAFVELETGDTGLIHISEIRTGFIENIHEALKVDEEVQVQVVDLDEFTGKASLSIRTLEEEKHQFPRRRRFSSDRFNYGFAPLKRMMPIWTKEALQHLKKQKNELEIYILCNVNINLL